jgi:hypothetical protein
MINAPNACIKKSGSGYMENTCINNAAAPSSKEEIITESALNVLILLKIINRKTVIREYTTLSAAIRYLAGAGMFIVSGIISSKFNKPIIKAMLLIRFDETERWYS